MCVLFNQLIPLIPGMENTKTYSFQRIMAIEDSQIDQYVIEQMMKRSNFAEQATICGSAKDALDKLGELNDNKDALPQIIFLDIHMPNMNGFAFLSELEKKYGHIKDLMSVIILTTSLDPIDRTTSNSYSNIKMYLNKPLTIDKLQYVKSQLGA